MDKVRKDFDKKNIVPAFRVTFRKERKDPVEFLFPILRLWAGCIIFTGWLRNLCGLEFSWLPCLTVTGMVSLLMEGIIREVPGKTGRFLFLCPGLLSLVCLLIPSVRRGVSGLCRDASVTLAKSGVGLFYKGSSGITLSEKTWAMAMITVFLLLLLGICFRIRSFPWMIFPLLMLFVRMRVGKGAGTLWVIAWMFWFLLLYVRSMRGYILMLIPLLILTGSEGAAGLFSLQRGWDEVWDSLRYGEKESVLPEGILGRAGSLDRGDEDVLSVSGDVSGYYYLKGFVGTTYRNNSWLYEDSNLSNFENGILRERQDFLCWFHERGYSGWNALSCRTKSEEEHGMSVRNIRASRRYLYLPYELTTTPAQLEKEKTGIYTTGDFILARGIMGKKNYTVHTTDSLVGKLSQRQLMQEQSAQGNTLQEETAFDCYEEYVNRTCLILPKDVKEYLTEKLEGRSTIGVEDPYAIVLHVRKWLEDHVEYDEHPETVPGDREFVSWFLEEAPRGYDIHYAAVAVMLFRYYGIPSRYVEGFLMEDTDVITRQAAHAWPEIYLKGCGWIPVEVLESYQKRMPSYLEEGGGIEFLSSHPEASDEKTTESESQEQEGRSSSDSSGKDPSGNDVETSEEKEDGIHSKESDASRLPVRPQWLILPGVLLGILLILLVLRLREMRVRRNMTRNLSGSQAVIMWYRQILFLLYEIEKNPDEKLSMSTDNRLIRWETRWKKHHPGIDGKKLRRVGLIRQKAIYRKAGISDEEAAFAVKFFQEEEKYLYERLSALSRFRVTHGLKPSFLQKQK